MKKKLPQHLPPVARVEPKKFLSHRKSPFHGRSTTKKIRQKNYPTPPTHGALKNAKKLTPKNHLFYHKNTPRYL